MATTTQDFEELLKARKGVVDFVEVPEAGYVMVRGTGAPGGEEFGEAVQALYTVSYGAHFLLRKRDGGAPRVMPLEALWWVDDPDQQALVHAVAAGEASMATGDMSRWHWQAMIMQPELIDAALVEEAMAQARAKKALPGLDRLRYVRWAEGRSAQILHVGPYSAEAPAIAKLHRAITEAGFVPRGRHHEIYLGDPRRSAPERLRTIIRQPIDAH
jgi:hypothetical protein